MTGRPDWLDRPEIRAVARAFEACGHRLWFVGGAVRDWLLGRPVADVDAATDAPPRAVMACLARHGIRAVPTGLEHGTVTAVVEGRPVEITTLRRDVATDGRRAVVAFSTDIAEDARRRDFTLNALYLTPDGRLLDPTGEGLADLRARRIRFIGEAERRIREDYLRILRFFRFLAWFGDPEAPPDAEALAAIRRNLDGLEHLSRERVGQEFRRLLAAPDPARAVMLMAETGVLERVLPDAKPAPLLRLLALERELSLPPDPIRRLAALGGDAPAERLRLSRAEARRLAALREWARSDAPPHELGYRLGADDGRDALLLRHALADTRPEAAELADVAEGARARFPIRARDLMPFFSGPELGRILRRLERLWIDARFRPGREELLGQADLPAGDDRADDDQR